MATTSTGEASGGVPVTPGAGDALATKPLLEVGGVQRFKTVLDMTEKSVTKYLEEITVDEIKAFTDSIEAVQGTEILSLLSSLFDFMGFDPNQIIRKLIAVNKYYREVKKLTDETPEILKIDVMMMISANIIMGNLQVKSVGRRSAKGRLAIEYLQAKYGMRIGSTGAGLPSDVLTFPRVANSFPVLTCRAAIVLPIKDFPMSPFKTKDLPKYMRVSAFCSFCHEDMNENLRAFLLQGVCAYSCDQMITVHEGEKKKRKVKKTDEVMSPQDAWALQWDYIVVASTSPVPDMKMKKAMLTELGVENHYTHMNDIVKNARSLIDDKTAIPNEQEFQSTIRAFISS